MRTKVAREQAIGEAHAQLLGEDIEGRFHALEREEKVEALLAELKERRKLSA
jgi:phage shock protein A